jgi:hypothetical protein
MRILTMFKPKNMSFPISQDKISASIAVTNYEHLSSPSPRNTRHRQKNTARKKIEEIAIRKYKTCGHGLNFIDVMEDFHIRKRQAQLTLKHQHNKGVFFTAKDLGRQGVNLMKNKKPQEYFPSCIKAEILENFKKKKYTNSSAPESLSTTIHPFQKDAIATAFEYQRAHSLLDTLLLLPYRTPYIHRLLLILRINRKHCAELREIKGKKKVETYEEIIGRRHVKYIISPNGTVQIAIRSNDTPFELETEQDISIIFSFFGQVRDRLLSLLGDPKELLVPSLMEWVLEQCDLNKDIDIDEAGQLTLPDLQLMHMDRVFRQYVKIIRGRAYYRIEESLQLNKLLPEALDNIRHPYRSFEGKIDYLAKIVEDHNQKIDTLIEENHGIKSIHLDRVQPNEPHRVAINSIDSNEINNEVDL